MDVNGTTILFERFSRNHNEESNENFYSLSKDAKNANIFSKKRWDEMIESGVITPVEGEDFSMIDKPEDEFGKDSDIEEKES